MFNWALMLISDEEAPMQKFITSSTRRVLMRCALWDVVLCCCAVSRGFANQPASGISFAQVSFGYTQPFSHYGKVSVRSEMLYGKGYINVERYEAGRAVAWVVRN